MTICWAESGGAGLRPSAITHREENMHSCLRKCPILHYQYFFSQFDHSYWDIDSATCDIGHWSHRLHADFTLTAVGRGLGDPMWSIWTLTQQACVILYMPKAETTLVFTFFGRNQHQIIMQILSNAKKKNYTETASKCKLKYLRSASFCFSLIWLAFVFLSL